jgi:signal peptidase I
VSLSCNDANLSSMSEWEPISDTATEAPVQETQPEFFLYPDCVHAQLEEEAMLNAPRSHRRSGWLTLQSLIVAVIVALFVMTFLEQPFQIPSQSMENTLLTGDYVLVDKVHYASPGLWQKLLPYEQVDRGDIVVFRPPPHPDQYYVKRVIGVPGDHVRLVDKQVIVNGRRVAEDYTQHVAGDSDHYRDNFPQPESVPDQDPHWWERMHNLVQHGELIVPAGSYFVLGDNREHSLDSRYWGLVPRQNIIGRPLLIYWSVDKDAAAVSGAANDKLSQLADLFYYVTHMPRWRRAMHVVQ